MMMLLLFFLCVLDLKVRERAYFIRVPKHSGATISKSASRVESFNHHECSTLFSPHEASSCDESDREGWDKREEVVDEE